MHFLEICHIYSDITANKFILLIQVAGRNSIFSP